MESVRISLPGYDALSDTNLDHYSLYADEDNVLIKRQQTGSDTITDGSPTIKTIAHNLGYVPFFMVYADRLSNGKYTIVNDQYNPFSVPDCIAFADNTNLYIYNFGGHTSGNLPVAWDIFYDNMTIGGSVNIAESKSVFKVSRPGIDALSSANPNDYIMHSDLNNYKILKQGSVSVNIASTSSYTFAHGATITTPCSYLMFIYDHNDSGNYYMVLGGTSTTNRFNNGNSFYGSTIDVNNITVTFPMQTATPDTITIVYFIFGKGKDNTIIQSKEEIVISKDGTDVEKITNPDDANFHSAYPTLKYFQESSYVMSVSNTTVQTIPHNLGYVPFFIGFVNDISGFTPSAASNFCIIPYWWGRSSIASPNQDIAAFMYADETNLYLKAYFQPNAVGTNVVFNFYYKIFKNNLQAL